MPRAGKRHLPFCLHGFTLLELIVVLAIFSILAAIAIPNWAILLPTYRLKSSARQVQSELHRIKMQAVSENVSSRLVFSEGALDYTVQRASNPLVTKPLPEGIVITETGTIFFSPRGTAGANRVRLQNVKGECTQVVVSPTGRIRICKPSGCNEDC
jgi:prepilin-type N-terminal cleavage/methylation domain-containing protein